MAKEVTTTNSSKKIEPKIKWQGTESFRHDLFKLGVSKCIKNKSYTQGDPNIVQVEHVHFFHSHSSEGNEHTRCEIAAGHYHEVKVSVDENGDFKAECGPAVSVETKIQGTIAYNEEGPIKFYDNKSRQWILDDHRHDISYIRSQMIMPASVKAAQEADKELFNKRYNANSGASTLQNKLNEESNA